MQDVPVTPALFEGAISVEAGPGWHKPWRLPHERLHLFPSPDGGLRLRAEMASGVRLRFASSTRNVLVTFLPLPPVMPACLRDVYRFDVTVNGQRVGTGEARAGDEQVPIAGLPAGEKALELWLPPDSPIAVRALRIDDGATFRRVADPRPRWVTYGSSLTHCVRAHGSARTWPALVAGRRGLNLTCLGYGGQCHLEPMIGLMIRDLPADLITLKLGINCVGGTLGARTFPSAVIGLVRIIREKHPVTPLALVSPIAYPPNETAPNVVGYTIGAMRRALEAVHRALVQDGDRNLRYVNGLEVFDAALIARYSVDQCHPNADGIEVMAENFDRAVMAPLLAGRRG